MRYTAFMLLIIAVMILAGPSGTAFCSEDYYTTDFLYPVQPYARAFHAFASVSSTMNMEGITGTNTVTKWGGDYSPVKGLDFFFVSQCLDADLKRTNRYRFSMKTTNTGFRVALLPYERNWCGISAGACWERSEPGHVYRNGYDLLISPLKEETDSFFILGTKEIKKNLFLNAGGKWGEARIGRRRPRVGNWGAGVDWQMNNQIQLSGNLKYLYHEGFPSNWNPSLRVTWKPCEPVYLQGHAGYYSSGLHSNYPVFEYYVPRDMMTRFGEKPQLYYGAEFSVQF